MIDAAELDHLARLAQLEIPEDERAALAGELGRILGYFELLREVDTDGVEEMQRPVALVNVLREDEPGEVFGRAVLEALAPEMQGGFVRVPRTVESE